MHLLAVLMYQHPLGISFPLSPLSSANEQFCTQHFQSQQPGQRFDQVLDFSKTAEKGVSDFLMFEVILDKLIPNTA